MLRRAVEASGEVIFTTDPAGIITYVNPEFVRLYGYTAEEVVGRATPRILKGGLVGTDDYAEFWRRLSADETVRREFVNRTKTGEVVWVESTANPVFSHDARVGFLAIQRDITARKATEAALRESERRYRTLADAAHDAIFIIDRDARITYANAAAAEQSGVPVHALAGRHLSDAFPPDAAATMWRDVLTAFETGDRCFSEVTIETPSGNRWLETWLVPMASPGARPDAVMGVARDVTGRKLLERQVAQAQKMDAIGQLAGGIAHDFNNVLTAILGYSELLLEHAGDDRAIAAEVEEVKKAAERAARLTRQLLAFARRQALAAQVLDLNDTLTELHKMLGRVIGEDVRLAIVTTPHLDRVKIDPGQIEQVIVNLAVNARDAMPRGGTLTIETANLVVDHARAAGHPDVAPGAYVTLSVRDTGSGMSRDVLAHVFEPFFTTKPPGKGTGLGLATVYGIVAQSGGHVAIDSAPGRGTTVTICLPRVDGEVAAAGPRARSASARGSETILLVEDEAAVRQLMERTLANLGYAVLKAATVHDAIALAGDRDRRIDLLLSDVVMPDLSGPDVAQRVVRLHPEIKVLYVSGFANRIPLDVGTLNRRASFLPKPFTPQALAAKVRECLDARF